MDVKKENFKRISENRKHKIIDMISKLSNLDNPSFYYYEEEDIESLFSELQKALDIQKDKFKIKSDKRYEL